MTLKVLFVSNNKMKCCSFGMYLFHTQGHIINLRNFITQVLLVSSCTMKTSTTQKSIIWSELKYVWLTTVKALVALHCLFGIHLYHTHKYFPNLRNFITRVVLIANNTTKTLNRQVFYKVIKKLGDLTFCFEQCN